MCERNGRTLLEKWSRFFLLNLFLLCVEMNIGLVLFFTNWSECWNVSFWPQWKCSLADNVNMCGEWMCKLPCDRARPHQVDSSNQKLFFLGHKTCSAQVREREWRRLVRPNLDEHTPHRANHSVSMTTRVNRHAICGGMLHGAAFSACLMLLRPQLQIPRRHLRLRDTLRTQRHVKLIMHQRWDYCSCQALVECWSSHCPLRSAVQPHTSLLLLPRRFAEQPSALRPSKIYYLPSFASFCDKIPSWDSGIAPIFRGVFVCHRPSSALFSSFLNTSPTPGNMHDTCSLIIHTLDMCGF